LAGLEIRRLCEKLGPTFIKLGQLASVRPDMVGPEILLELEKLQDQVSPVPADQIRSALIQELGHPPEDLFIDFEHKPVAAGSIAQVHRARLASDYRPVVGPNLPAGTPIAIKVLRPGIEALISADLKLARKWTRRAGRIRKLARFRPESLIDEFSEMLDCELDLRREGRLADRFSRDFAGDEFVRVPRVVWRLSTQSVLVSEFVEGWRHTELGPAERAGIDARALAIHGADVFMRQVLVLGYFHADLHPANLLVTPEGQLCFLDFGIVGRTTPAQREAIAQVMIGLVYGDADRALKYSRALGLEVPPKQELVVRQKMDGLVNRHLLEPEIADVRGFALGFLRMLADEQITIPAGYGLLIKSLVTVEGVSQAIFPDLDLIEAAKPFATRLIAEQMIQPQRLRKRLVAARRAAIKELLA
jgi:ubiquinone biosynthesis protein